MRDRSFEPATTCDNVLCARASALCDAQRPFQSVPAHPRITKVTPSRTSQSKGGGQENGMLVYSYDLEKTMSINS